MQYVYICIYFHVANKLLYPDDELSIAKALGERGIPTESLTCNVASILRKFML
jgi:hypothetical protein